LPFHQGSWLIAAWVSILRICLLVRRRGIARERQHIFESSEIVA
jgi:hypothetical protein